MLKIISSAILAGALLCAAPAFAKVYTVQVTNKTGEKMINISIVGKHGTVVGFVPTSAKEFELRVDLPEGSVCNPVVRFQLSTLRRIEGRASLCQGGNVVIAWPWN